MLEFNNIIRKGDFYMHSMKMWEIFVNTGNIEAYLYDRIYRDKVKQSYRAGLKDAILGVTTLKEKDGTKG